MDVVLHFDGLPAGYHTYFNNRWGAEVRINPGDWVILNTTANPTWRSWLDRGLAHQADAIPDDVDFLYERSKPAPLQLSPPWGEGKPPRGAFALCGPVVQPVEIPMSDGRMCTVLDLLPADIERIRLRWMPFELPGMVHVDARRDKRGHRPVHTLPPLFERNFFLLMRLAWLSCRVRVEESVQREIEDWRAYQRNVRRMGLPEDPERRPSRAETHKRVEEATAEVLRGWGVLRGASMPDRATLYRNMKCAMLTVDDIDEVILRDWKEIVDADRSS